MAVILPLIIVLLCICTEAFFSGSEIAVISANKVKIRQQAEAGSSYAKIVAEIMERPERLLATTLIGTNLSVITASIIITFFMRAHFPEHGEILTFLMMSPLTVIFGETIPKSVCQQNADRLIAKIIFPLWLLSKLFAPVISVIGIFTNAVINFFRKQFGQEAIFTKESLNLILKLIGPESNIKASETAMIKRIFKFPHTIVHDMMIPLIDVAALPEDATISDMRRLVDTKGYSRIPIFKDRIYNIIGMIESFDFLDAEGEYSSIKPYIRPILYLPESISAENALLIMQKERCSIAAAVNEYGGTEGIITVEDILEEIVGEIEDEYDMSKRYFKKVGENHYIIYARMEIDKLPELGIFIEEGDFETLGGFLLEKFGKIPQEGEIISYNGHSFKIRKATNRSIEEVEVKPLTQTESKSV